MRAPTRRLIEVLGPDIQSVTDQTISDLVTHAVAEHDDLDFKASLYGKGDSDKRELAGDVAAFANAGGGVIILGVREEAAVAVDHERVELSDAEEGRMRQIVASYVAPVPEWTIQRVPSAADPAIGSYVVTVPSSSDAPHAVRVNEALRYPRRDGTTTRWLSESEVANAYRNRFAAAGAQLSRVDELLGEGCTLSLAAVEEPSLVLACVPNRPGNWTVDRKSMEKMRSFVRQPIYPHFIDSYFSHYDPTASVGYRRVVLRLAGGQQGGAVATVHCHADGSSMIAVNVGGQGRDPAGREQLQELWIGDERLAQETIAALAIASAHAVNNAGCSGDAAIATTIQHPNLPIWVVHGRGFTNKWHADAGTTAIPRIHHTLNLDDMQDPVGLVSATRVALTDLFQALQVPECHPFTADNEVRRRYWSDTRRIEQVCAQWGLQSTDDVV